MQWVRYAGAELKTRGINHRVGTFRYKELGEGQAGTPGNFNLRMVWSETDFFSPRHMHNFDQVRVQVQGTFHFDTDGSMQPGAVAYFPEGTPYGPQTSNEETATLVMQIGGASGNGYLSEEERVRAVDELAARGVFRKGRYYGNAEGEGPGTDAFQAAWEHAHGRKMKYPERRFQKPMLTRPEVAEWKPLAGAPGVACKRVWDFGPMTVRMDQYQLAEGSSLVLTGPLSCFVQHGGGTAQAQSAQALFAPFDAVHAVAGESVSFTAAQATQLLVFGHPAF